MEIEKAFALFERRDYAGAQERLGLLNESIPDPDAVIREEQEKYDMATLLLYRLLEMIERRRLALYNLV